MKPWEELETATMPDGSRIKLQRHDGNYVIQADGYDLMTSYSHGSEDAMMSLACPRPPVDSCILIGGLGMGYTLAATLKLMPPEGTVVVSELISEVVEWNHGPLGPLAGHPLNDPRVDLVVGDVADVDSFIVPHNSWLYTPDGLAAAHRALRPCGALGIWSVGTEKTFERRLRRAGFTASTHPVRGQGKRGGHYSVIVGRRH